MKIFINKLKLYLKNHQKSREWLWFIFLWFVGLVFVVIMTYPIKFIIKFL